MQISDTKVRMTHRSTLAEAWGPGETVRQRVRLKVSTRLQVVEGDFYSPQKLKDMRRSINL